MSYKDRACRAAVLCVLAGSAVTCARAPRPSVERIAIVAFDNLSSDPAVSWIGPAAAVVAAAQTGGDERMQTFAVGTLRDAQTRLATRLIDGYLTRDGGRIALKTTVRNELSGQTASAATISGGDIFAIASAVARQTGAPVSGYTTSNAAAVQAYVSAMGESEPARTEALLRQAIRLDPVYGAPYLPLRDLLVRTGRQEEAQSLLSGASRLRFTKPESARLRALTAKTAAGQVDALLAVAKLQPGDLATWRQANEAAMNLRLYDKALVAMDELLKLSPNDEVALNVRGYAHLYMGNFEAARTAFEEYRKRRPESANAIDSMAEMMFYFRRYSDAAKLFLEAHAKNPEMLNGFEPFRAAYSHYLAGNLAEADRVFANQVTNPKDVRYAVWRRWTGRPAGEAPTLLRALWALRDGDRKTAAELAAAARREANNPGAASLASVAMVLSQPSASPDEWRSRVQKALPAPQQEGIREQLLGWALLLDGHGREAASQWRPLFERASGQFNNEQRILLATSLVAAGQVDEARKVMPHGFLPPNGMPANLDLLLYPIAAETSRKLK